MSSLRALGFSGSLRRASYNSALLRAAQDLVPAGMSLELYPLDGLPMINMDLVSPAGEFPAPVAALRAAVAAADCLVIASPEYNFSLSPVIKNAIDWASRPPSPPLEGKPVAIMGATPGRTGTARGQMALRQALQFSNMFPLNRPEVMVGEAAAKFDPDGRLVDAGTREHVARQLVALATWTRQLKAGG
jgi:chromate reductase